PGHPFDRRAGGVRFRHPVEGRPELAQERSPVQATRRARPPGAGARQGDDMTAEKLTVPIGVEGVRGKLRHRYPFLLIDRVVEFEEAARRVLAYKNVTSNEAYFQGHFPERTVLSAELVIDAIEQAGGLLTQLLRGGASPGERLSYLVKVDNARFANMVVPGDRLDIEVTIRREIRNMTLYAGVATVDGAQVASAEILCAEVDA